MSPIKAVNYFVPETWDADSDQYHIGRALVLTSLVVGSIILLFLANRVRLNGLFSVYSTTLGMAAISVFVIPMILKFTESITLVSIGLILVLSVLIITLTFITGGPFSPSLVFIAAFPLGGILFVSSRFGIFLSALFTFHLAFLTWAYYTDNLPSMDLSEPTLAALNVACTAAVTIVFGILATLHVSWQNSVREKLEETNLSKSEFLSGMSHELRTPLNSIMGFSDLLRRGYVGQLTASQEDYANKILASSTHMLALINDLLDIAKIESGELGLELSPVSIEETITSCKQMMSEAAGRKRIRIDARTADDFSGAVVNLDEMKIKQILLNLLSNAVKFSPENSLVQLTADIVSDNIVMTVHDEGDGIPAEHEDHVFEKFFQVHSKNYNKSAGTGLGLPISRYFAELHGGSLEIQKSPFSDARGATFVLTIPLTTGTGQIRQPISISQHSLPSTP